MQLLFSSLRFGLIAGIVPCLAMLSGKIFGLYDGHPDRVQAIFFWASSLTMLLVILIAVHQAQKKGGEGRIEWKNGLRTGIAVAGIASLCIAAFFPVYFNYLDPEWLPAKIAETWADGRAQKIAELRIQEYVTQLEQTNFTTMGLKLAFVTLTVGMFEAVVSTFFVRSLRP